MKNTATLALAAMAAAAIGSAAPASTPPPNLVSVQAAVSVDYDSASGLYTYAYSFTNAPTSQQEVATIFIPLNGSSVLGILAPQGWTAGVWHDGSTISFAATEGVIVPPGYVDNGGLLPSPFQIKQGQALSGFSFQSPDPPDLIDFFAQGFTQLPVLGVDVPDPEEPFTPPGPFDPSQSFKGSTQGPHFSSQLFAGGRRPAVDGFLEFQNLTNRATKPAPVQVDILFGANGETVFQDTFKALLNNQDVTAQFLVIDSTHRRAVFQANNPALIVGGRNVLLTVVDGNVAGTTRTAKDVDRLVFNVVP